MSEKNVVLNNNTYEDFIRCLNILKDICGDVDIKEGVIRQKTNDLLSIFEIDLKEIIEDLSIPITNLNQKLELFKMFIGNDDQEITIRVNDISYSFSDQYSEINFKKPFVEYIEKHNKFINKETLDNNFSLNPDENLISCQIPKFISDRIKNVTKVFNVNNVGIRFSKENGILFTKTQNGEQEATFLKDIALNKIFENDNISNIISIPFIIDHDNDIMLESYEYRKGFCINKFNTNISNTNINIYSTSKLDEIK